METVSQFVIARASGVSRSTVALALNPKLSCRVNRETRRRVLDTAARLGYRPNPYACRMRQRRTGIIGMLSIHAATELAFARSLHAARFIHETGFQLLALDAAWFRQGAHEACEALLDARVEGVLLSTTPSWFPVEALAKLRNADVPMVSLSGVSLPGVPQVRPDVADGMRRLATHLLAQGRRKLVLLTRAAQARGMTDEEWPVRERIEGFHAALAEFKDRRAQGDVLSETPLPDWSKSYQVGATGMRGLLTRAARPDAVLCANDDWAVGALAVCAEKGVRVPEDLAVTGFDGSSLSEFLAPPLTTVAQPTEEIARRGVEVLTRLIRGEKLAEQDWLVKLPCQLVVRKSCGAKLVRATGRTL